VRCWKFALGISAPCNELGINCNDLTLTEKTMVVVAGGDWALRH
jgi:hypothetical protein